MLLDLLPPELRSLLLAASVERRFRDGETIHHRADRRRSLSIVRSGAVRIETTGADGVVRAMALLSPGHSFGEITVVAGLPRANDAVAVGPTIVADVEEAAFHRLLADHPAVGKALLI